MPNPETTAERAPVDRDECLRLLDHVDSVMRWCACNMPNGPRFQKGNAALWAVVHRLAGANDVADRLIQENDLTGDAA